MFNTEYIVPGVISYLHNVQLDTEPTFIREAKVIDGVYVLEDCWYYLVANAKPEINGCEVRPLYGKQSTTLPCINKDGKLCFHPSFLNPTKYLFNDLIFEITGNYTPVMLGSVSSFEVNIKEPSLLIRDGKTTNVITVIDTAGRFYEVHDDQMCILCKPGKYTINSHGNSLNIALDKATVPEGFADSVYITKA